MNEKQFCVEQVMQKKGRTQAAKKLEANIIGCALFCKFISEDGNECSYLTSIQGNGKADDCIKDQDTISVQDWTLIDIESSEPISSSDSFSSFQPLVKLDEQIENDFSIHDKIRKNITQSIMKIISR